MNRNLMILGTESGVGKTTVSIALCRYLKNQGYNIAPFKSISICREVKKNDLGEYISVEEFVQAEACEINPRGILNPICIKEDSNKILINGKFYRNKENFKSDELIEDFKAFITEDFEKVCKDYEYRIIEGNGSISQKGYEYNFISNDFTKEISDSDIILLSDNERGAAIPSLYGTLMIIDENIKKSIKGIIINKNKDNSDSFKEQLKQFEEYFNIPILGTIPYENIELDKEKTVIKKIRSTKRSGLNIAIVKLDNISNLTDFYPLELEKNINIRYVSSENEIEGAHLIIIPSTKDILGDLNKLKENGMYNKILELHKNGATVMGICSGFQMLGKHLIATEEKMPIEGFEMLSFNTKLSLNKKTAIARGIVCQMENELKSLSNIKIYGYEIQNGYSEMLDGGEVFIIDKNNNIVGLSNETGDVFGTYIHGIFEVEEFRKKLLNSLKEKYNVVIENSVEEKENYKIYRLKQYDKLAKLIEENVDLLKVKEFLEDSENIINKEIELENTKDNKEVR